jgi:opacity protein-like surface antigen
MQVRGITLAVMAALLLPAGAGAQALADYDYENLLFRGLGADWGYIWPSKVEATHVYSLRLDLGYLGPAVRIAPSLSYWNSRLKAEELDRLAQRISGLPPLVEEDVVLEADDLGQVTWSDLSLSVDAHLVWTVPLRLMTYLGAGVALHALNGRGEVIEDTFVEDLLDSTAAGVAVMAGVEAQPLPTLRLYGEARYTLADAVRYPGIRLGAALMLPPRGGAPQPTGQRQ